MPSFGRNNCPHDSITAIILALAVTAALVIADILLFFLSKLLSNVKRYSQNGSNLTRRYKQKDIRNIK